MQLNIIYTIILVIITAVITYIYVYSKKLNQFRTKINSLQKEIELKEKETEILKLKQDKFWKVISYQLKTLFYTFFNSIELLNTEYDNLKDEEKKSIIYNVSKSYDQTLGIINELLEWIKIGKGRTTSKPEYFNLSALVEENLLGMRTKIEEKEIVIDMEMGENIPVYSDKMMINFVIKGILENAVKFSHRKGMVKLRNGKIGNRAELQISDFGIGIPKENLEKLFLLDEIISTSGTENEKGSGLGLLICKDFVEANIGKLTINSEFGKGTTVSIILPGTEN